jgi:hypothetical protein
MARPSDIASHPRKTRRRFPSNPTPRSLSRRGDMLIPDSQRVVTGYLHSLKRSDPSRLDVFAAQCVQPSPVKAIGLIQLLTRGDDGEPQESGVLFFHW